MSESETDSDDYHVYQKFEKIDSDDFFSLDRDGKIRVIKFLFENYFDGKGFIQIMKTILKDTENKKLVKDYIELNIDLERKKTLNILLGM